MSDPRSPIDLRSVIDRIIAALRSVVKFAERLLLHATIFDQLIPKRRSKLKISFPKYDVIITVSHYYSLLQQGWSDVSEAAKVQLPMLLRGTELFPLSGLMPIDPDALEAKVQEGTLGLRYGIASRLSELKHEAELESLPYSQESEHDLFKFFFLHPTQSRPYLFLLENGNLRALWKNKDGEQVGLQFRGSELVQYVIFARRGQSELMTRSAGRDLLSNMERLIAAHDAGKLMFGGVTH